MTNAMTNRRLYVAHEPRGANIDMKPLYDYAKEHNLEIRFVFSAKYSLSQHPKESMAVAQNFAAEMDPTKDVFAVIGGDPLAGMICMAALVREMIPLNVTSIRSLRYVRERDKNGNRTIASYIEIELPIGGD